MPEFRPHRTVLYLPASNARAVGKARTLAADSLILDLEDAVAPAAKEDARRAAVAALREGGFGNRDVTVRANGLGTDWAAADFAALADAPVAAIVVPKVETAADARAAVGMAGGHPVWVMVETPRAIQEVDAIAATPGVTALVAGFNDLAKDLHLRPGSGRAPLHYAMSRMIVAARAAGILAFDGVFGAIHDLNGLGREALEAQAFGFDGKTCIHPAQLDAVNRAFSPSPEDIAEAEGMVAAYDAAMAAGQGVATYKGRMVENLHVETARKLLATARALGLAG